MKKIPTFIAGMLTTVLIGSLGITALAATGTMTITVDPVNIQVNGATFAPKDATGADVPVFALDGTTYAPLRALAEAYGLEVGYDAGANMATVGEKGVTPPPTTEPTTPVDPNHVPDITLDELKELFAFDQAGPTSTADVYYWKYGGDKPIVEFIEYWKTLNQDDVKAALTTWIESHYKNEYTGNRAIRFELYGEKNGTSMRFSRISYTPEDGISKFYFGWWG